MGHGLGRRRNYRTDLGAGGRRSATLPLPLRCHELLRTHWLQTTLIEAAKLAPRWNPQRAALHARELERGHRNRATLAVAPKLVAYLLAVDKSGQRFHLPAPSEELTQKLPKRGNH